MPIAERRDDHPADVVEDVVPAEVHGRDDGEDGEDPDDRPDRAGRAEDVGGEHDRAPDGRVQGGEGADALRRTGRRWIGEEGGTSLHQRHLQVSHRRVGQARERRRVEVEGPDRREDEVAARAEQPGERERGRDEQARPQVRQQHEPGRQRQRDDGEEDHVDRRQRVRRPARAQQVVQRDVRVVTAQQPAVDVQQLGVEHVARAQERCDALDVAVRQVGHVEAGDRHRDDGEAARRPARPADLGDRARGGHAPVRARGAHDDVEQQEPDGHRDGHGQAPDGDRVGIAQGDTCDRRRDARAQQRGRSDDRRRERRAPRRERRFGTLGAQGLGCCGQRFLELSSEIGR